MYTCLVYILNQTYCDYGIKMLLQKYCYSKDFTMLCCVSTCSNYVCKYEFNILYSKGKLYHMCFHNAA